MPIALAAALVTALVTAGLAACGEGGTPPSVDTTPSASPSALPSPVSPSSTSPPSASPSPAGTATNLVDEGYRGRFRVTGTVLENGAHGPQLCLGGIALSLPPQCGGPDIVGWSWAGLTGVQSVSGTKDGVFVVTGTFDGTRFTLTEKPTAPDLSASTREPTQDFTSPCPAPSGGWVPPDPARATDATFDTAMQLAQQRPGYAVSWIDQNVPPGVEITDNTASPDPRAIPNDPQRIVMNIKVTKDVAGMEKAVRAVWGGNLCVTTAPRTEAELHRVQDAIMKTPGLLESSPNGFTGQVDVRVVRGTVQQQAAFDAAYGAGVVNLRGALVPIDG